MSGKDSERGATRRGFGFILGGLAAGAVLGTTVVAHAEDGDEAGATGLDGKTARLGSADAQRISHRDIDSLAVKLDGLELSGNERALLVGLLGVAADTIGRSRTERPISPLVSTVKSEGAPIGVQSDGGLPSVRDQFRTAFTPGAVRPGALGHLGEIIEIHID